MSNNERVFFTLESALYEGRSLGEVIQLTCQKLMNIGTIDSINRANLIRRYYKISTNESYIKLVQSTFKTIETHLKKTTLNDVSFEIAVRIKSLISLWEKAEKIFQQGRDYAEILDILGMRIIVEEMDEYKSIEYLADIANSVLDLAVSKEWSISHLFCTIEDFPAEEYPDIIIPKNDVKDSYKAYCKNYCKHPKSNGYQSLHINIKPKNDVPMEIQIRTWQQHDRSENPYFKFQDLSHEEYKKKEYEYSQLHYKIEEVKAIKFGARGSILDPYGITIPRIIQVHKHIPF